MARSTLSPLAGFCLLGALLAWGCESPDEDGTGDHAGSGSGGDDSQLPDGTILPAPDGPPEGHEPSWPLAESLLGDPGWKNSTEPFCSTAYAGLRGGSGELDVDAQGIYTRHGLNCDPATLDAHCGYTTEVLRNQGDGWEVFYGPDDENALYDMNVNLDSKLLVRSEDCAARLVSADGLGECELAENSTDLASFGPDRVFALIQDKLWQRQDAVWTERAQLPLAGERLFVGADFVLVNAPYSLFFLKEGEREVVTLPPPPAASSYAALWAFADDDVWLGEKGALFHFDGSSWTILELGNVGPVRQILGIEEQLYFATDNVFGRLEGKKPVVLFGNDPADTTALLHFHAGFAGISRDQIFFVGARSEGECEGFNVYHFDGEQLHAF